MSNLPHTVKRSVLLDVPAAEVWEAVVDAAALSEWLAPEVELDPREGGEIVCRYEDGEERRGEVELVAEAERLCFRWWREDTGPSRVELALDAIAGRTLLTVTETSLAPPLTALGWTPRLAVLGRVAGRLALA